MKYSALPTTVQEAIKKVMSENKKLTKENLVLTRFIVGMGVAFFLFIFATFYVLQEHCSSSLSNEEDILIDQYYEDEDFYN